MEPEAKKARIPPVRPSQAAAVSWAPAATDTVVYSGTATTCVTWAAKVDSSAGVRAMEVAVRLVTR